MDAKDCGLACLKIIAKYYSLQYLRDLCGITKEGVSFLDIGYAAEKIGLRSIGLLVKIDRIVDKKIGFVLCIGMIGILLSFIKLIGESCLFRIWPKGF